MDHKRTITARDGDLRSGHCRIVGRIAWGSAACMVFEWIARTTARFRSGRQGVQDDQRTVRSRRRVDVACVTGWCRRRRAVAREGWGEWALVSIHHGHVPLLECCPICSRGRRGASCDDQLSRGVGLCPGTRYRLLHRRLSRSQFAYMVGACWWLALGHGRTMVSGSMGRVFPR